MTGCLRCRDLRVALEVDDDELILATLERIFAEPPADPEKTLANTAGPESQERPKGRP